MATQLATVTGNLTGSVWAPGNTGSNAVLISTSASTTALTTSNLDSATFTPAAQASQYLAVRIGSRASGSPTNKMTIKLRNSTTATDIWTFVINVSDIDACDTTADQGGWYVFKAAASHTPNGTDTYVVRAVLDSTSTAVALCTNGTANNWQRILGQATAGNAVAGDDLYVSGIWDTTNPAVKTNVSVTMDETATTDYGSNTNNVRTPALAISKGGTLTYATTASTNYYLRLSGDLIIFSSGTFNIGTSGTPIPRSGSAILELDPGADEQMGIEVRNGGTWNSYGQSRLSGVNSSLVTLSADAAAAATTVSTSSQLSAKSGDTVLFGSTSSTIGEMETKTLNADAGASSISLSAGLTNAHKGTTFPVRGEVLVLDRNVIIRTSNSARRSYIRTGTTDTTFNASWAAFFYFGHTTTVMTLNANTLTLDRTIVRDSTGSLTIGNSGTLTGLVITELTVYNTGQNIFSTGLSLSSGISGGSINGLFVLGPTGVQNTGMGLSVPTAAYSQFTNLRIVSNSGSNSNTLVIGAGDWKGQTLDSFNLHSNASTITFNSGCYNLNLTNFYAWNNKSASGHVILNASDITFTTGAIAGGSNINANVRVAGSGIVMNGVTIAGLSGSSTQYGIILTGVTEMLLNNCILGTSSAPYATHTSNDVYSNNARTYYRITCRGCTFGGTNSLISYGTSFFATDNGTTTNNTANAYVGTVARDTSVVDISPSMKMTPLTATKKLTSSIWWGGEFLVPVDSGTAPSVSVKVQTDGTYNGAAPRLILRANAALGVNSDTVIATWSGSSGSWITLSGTAPSPTDSGVYEFFVDCDGTAGNVYVDTFKVTAGGGTLAPGDLIYWRSGLPEVEVTNASGGSGPGGGVSRSRVVNHQ